MDVRCPMSAADPRRMRLLCLCQTFKAERREVIELLRAVADELERTPEQEKAARQRKYEEDDDEL